ncbi:MAG: hypothetical protein F4X54_02550 [Chloroflexi bacterium]|nr:hypothetical protein [Chloroflexota bacterium]MXY59869.1 hypothetical protein [Chloroflexota bacterium]MYB83624.1 hypothetical protein [Chloroflexota bacterium]
MSGRTLAITAAIWLTLVIFPYLLGVVWLGSKLDKSYVVAFMAWFVIAATLSSAAYVMHVRESQQQH